MINSPFLISRLCRFSCVAMLAVASSVVCAQTSSSTYYGLSKQLGYVQTSAAAPVLETPQPARFETIGELAGSLRLPAGNTLNFTAGNGIDQRFASSAAMDAAFPAGAYTMTVGTVSGISFTMPANPYPADVPRVLNGTWNAAGRLVVDPTKDYTITINSFSGFNPAGGLGNIYLSIWFNDDDDLVNREQFSSQNPNPFTTVTIPAGTLVAGRTYNAEVAFIATPSLNTTSIPGAFGAVIGVNQTTFQIAAVAPASAAPTIVAQPAAKTIATGSTVVFSVAADGMPAPAYQWRRGTTVLTGETRPTLVLSGAAAVAGNYNCVVTNSGGSVTSADALLTVNNVAATDVGRLINLSVLAPTGPGAQLLTMGATVGGQGATGGLPLVIRGVGPTLGTLGVGGTLADPVLSIFPAGSATASVTNDNWGGTTALVAAFASVGAFSLPAASLDSAALQNQAAGGFTVQVAGKGTAAGMVIAEVYDAGGATRGATTPRLTNLSTLTSVAPVGSLTAGFVVGGTTARTVLVRAVGPTLETAFRISGAMPDPKLELFNNEAVKIGENDNWGGAAWLLSTHTAVGAFALGGAATKDAAMVVTLAPGAYSARVSGVNGASGTAIIEVYEVP